MTGSVPASKVIDGKAFAAGLRARIADAVPAFRAATGRVPGLAVVLVGDDPASAVYVHHKTKDCEEVGMRGQQIRMPASTSEAELLAVVDRLNADPSVHGILVQMPVPRQIDPAAVIARIDPDKDVDGFHPTNVGRVYVGDASGFAPCTPAGVMVMLR